MRLSLHIRFRDVMTAQARPIRVLGLDDLTYIHIYTHSTFMTHTVSNTRTEYKAPVDAGWQDSTCTDSTDSQKCF